MAPVKETEYLREKVHDNNKLPMNYENLEPSNIQSTQEELKKTEREMQFLGNNEQPRAEDPIADYDKPLISYKNLQPSHIQSPQQNLRAPGNAEPYSQSLQDRPGQVHVHTCEVRLTE